MSVRIYKDNLRQSIFRTLLLTDIAIFILLAAFIAGFSLLFFKLLPIKFNWLTYLFITGILESTFLVIATLKIDNQPIYKILSRAIVFTFVKKKLRGNQLGSYYNDFSIQDDLIVRSKSIAKVFRINPYDISALNDDDRQRFFANLKQALHILPSRLQVIVRKEVAKAADFTDHLLHVYKSLPKGNATKEAMVANYQRELLDFVEHEKLLTIKQYGIFAANADAQNVDGKVKAIGKLDDMYTRLSTSLENCHVSTKQLTNDELEQFMGRLLR